MLPDGVCSGRPGLVAAGELFDRRRTSRGCATRPGVEKIVRPSMPMGASGCAGKVGARGRGRRGMQLHAACARQESGQRLFSGEKLVAAEWRLAERCQPYMRMRVHSTVCYYSNTCRADVLVCRRCLVPFLFT